MLTTWSWSYLQLCWRARHSEQCSRTCHHHHSNQRDSRDRRIHLGHSSGRLPEGDHGGVLTNCLSRPDHRNWVLHSSTNSRCSAVLQKRSPRRYRFRSTGLVTGISKNRLILLLCWRMHSKRIGKSDLHRQSPKTLWPRRLWRRSKCVCTWRRETACKPDAGRFQQVACLISGSARGSRKWC